VHYFSNEGMKIALVHDQLAEFGGAERVLFAMSEIWPEAPIYTAFVRPGPALDRFKDRDIRVSWAHAIPDFATKLHSPLRFLAPAIWNTFDFSGYDVIIGSSSWYITKGFLNKGSSTGSGRTKTVEICYCHTPPRWLYGYATARQQKAAKLYGTIVGFFMRHYDYEAAQRVHYFLANSRETARRIQKFYRRESTVIYPPIEIPKGNPLPMRGVPSQPYFLIVSRLAQPKNVELAIRVANREKYVLKIVGSGPDEGRLRGLAGPTVEFLGYLPDGELGPLYAGAEAFLALSPDEDFGMTPVEAMAMGTPVIAYRGGGYLETVVDGKTGIFFPKPTEQSLASAIRKFSKTRRNWVTECQNQAKTFSKERFKRELKAFVEEKISRAFPT